MRRKKPPSFKLHLGAYLAIAVAVFGALVFWIVGTGCAVSPYFDFRISTAPSSDCMSGSGVTALVGVIAAWAATSGWLIQWNNTRTIARKQHTMNVLSSRSHSDVFNTHMINVRSIYRIDRQLTADEATAFDEAYNNPALYRIHDTSRRTIVPPAASVVYIVNYFESIAAAIMSGDMDEMLVKRTLMPTILSTVARYWPVLKNDIGIARFGDEPPGKYAVYSELYRLARHWGLEADHVENFDAGKIAAITNA